MFISASQIQESLTKLNSLNPFFGVAFLAFKKSEIPIGSTKQLVFSQVVDTVLKAHYRPIPGFPKYYIPFRSSTPNDRWNSQRYASTTMQRTTVDTFSDVLIHPKKSQVWGWKPDYLNILLMSHLSEDKIPVFDLAVWLFRDREWFEGINKTSVVEAFYLDFKIRTEERILFSEKYKEQIEFGDWLQSTRISDDALLNIIGEPSNVSSTKGSNLAFLHLDSVGPVQQVEMELAPRLNIITGDNGLGKTFILDCAWWALTGNWASDQAYPRSRNRKSGDSRIIFSINTSRKLETYSGRFDKSRDYWRIVETRPASKRKRHLPGLCIYARADGSVVIWDPAKRRLLDTGTDYHLSMDPQIILNRLEILYGKNVDSRGRPTIICRGLLQDWLEWQYGSDKDRRNFDLFTQAIELVSPHPDELLKPGERIQVPPDLRFIPTLKFSYGDVPFIYCSAGIQRVVSLVYILLWAWLEHLRTSDFLETEPEQNIVLLVDEMEAHLHPFWQRTVIPALMEIIDSLNRQVNIQGLIATHSPLILASVESIFDEEIDNLFHLHLSKRGQIELDNLPFVKQGRVDRWLTSEVFGLSEPRALDAEKAISDAIRIQKRKSVSREEVQIITNELLNVLSQDDQFWTRWIYFARNMGVNI